MEKTSSKNIIFWVITFMVIIVATISFSYAIFNYMRVGKTSSAVQSGSIKMRYDGDNPGINLVDSEPVSDEDALNSINNTFTFNVEYEINGNAKITYGVYLENLTETLPDIISGEYTSLPSDKLKIALEDLTSNKIVVNPIFYNSILENPTGENIGNLLYSRTVSGKNIDSFKLYLWIPNVDINNNPVNIMDLYSKTFSFIVNVKAIASVNE